MKVAEGLSGSQVGLAGACPYDVAGMTVLAHGIMLYIYRLEFV